MDNSLSQLIQQGTPEWYRARIGMLTSSNAHYLMLESAEEKAYIKEMDKGTPKKGESAEEYSARLQALKDAALNHPFSDTARSYLYQVAAERHIRPEVLNDDLKFAEYLDRVDISTRDMRYGSDNEELARTMYAIKCLGEGYEVSKAGFYANPDIYRYGDSPDGLVIDTSTFERVGCIEIKCPKPGTFVKYVHEMHEMAPEGKSWGDALKEVKPEYYWQCQSHMLCYGVEWCDFIVFDKMLNGGLRVYRIERDMADLIMLQTRIDMANMFIDSCIYGTGYDISDVDDYDVSVQQ